MDAVKFIEERKRLCKMYSGCTVCPVYRDNDTCLFSDTNGGTPDEQVKILQVWSDAHPRKTRQSMLLEQWPKVEKDNNGLCTLCPKHFDTGVFCVSDGGTLKVCTDCRREFWLQEVE